MQKNGQHFHRLQGVFDGHLRRRGYIRSMNSLLQLAGNTDIYLVDQILKNRYLPGEHILDAGCGSGRNLYWFLNEGFAIYGVDANAGAIDLLRSQLPETAAARFHCAAVEEMPFSSGSFHHVISNAVLHFANSEEHYFAMMQEMVRVLKPGGSLFIRMTSNTGIEHLVQHQGQGVYLIPDGSLRFLLTPALLEKTLRQFSLSLAEPFKTVNVNNERCMSTIVAVKNG